MFIRPSRSKSGFRPAGRAGLSLCAALTLAISPLAAGAAQDAEKAAFCAALAQVNRGAVDTRGLSELQGHARVLQQLVDAAPAAVRADLQTLHAAMLGWAEALSGKESMLVAFGRLADPQLANVEGRIADYIAGACGIRLGSGEYRADKRAVLPTRCPAWTGYTSPYTANRFPNYIDISGGNYFAQRFWLRDDVPAPPGMFKVEYGGWVEFHGRYPYARYFAYHPNDEDMNNLETLRDQDIAPDPGSVNPFWSAAAGDAKRYYTVRLAFSQKPEHPLPNTRYVGARKDGITPNGWVNNILRLYASDLGNTANSGGVPLPAMTIYNARGEVTYRAGECEAYPPDEEPARDRTLFPSLPIADYRASNPARWSTSSNFNAPTDSWANADVQYLSTTFSRRFGNLFVVRARFPSTPDSRGGEPVSAAGKKDARLWTLCIYNIWAGIANDCRIDHEFSTDSRGFYTVVVSERDHRPANLKQQYATWMDWGAYLDGQLTYRALYRDNPLWRQVAFGVSGGRVAPQMQPYVPAAVPCDKGTFEKSGWQGCFKQQGIDPAAYQ